MYSIHHSLCFILQLYALKSNQSWAQENETRPDWAERGETLPRGMMVTDMQLFFFLCNPNQ